MDILFYLIILIIPISAQIYVKSNYNKYIEIDNENKISGVEVARKMLDSNGLDNIHVVETNGLLSDHYDPTRKVVRLSHDVFHGNSISATAIAAHEVGHAIQDKEGYIFMRIRSLIFPVVKLGTQLSYILIGIGVLVELLNLIYIGIALVSLGLIFQLVTLPVEFDASKRAKAQLLKLQMTSDSDVIGVEKVLNAAAMTYVAGVLTALLQLIRLILVFGNRD